MLTIVILVLLVASFWAILAWANLLILRNEVRKIYVKNNRVFTDYGLGMTLMVISMMSCKRTFGRYLGRSASVYWALSPVWALSRYGQLLDELEYAMGTENEGKTLVELGWMEP